MIDQLVKELENLGVVGIRTRLASLTGTERTELLFDQIGTINVPAGKSRVLLNEILADSQGLPTLEELAAALTAKKEAERYPVTAHKLAERMTYLDGMLKTTDAEINALPPHKSLQSGFTRALESSNASLRGVAKCNRCCSCARGVARSPRRIVGYAIFS